MPYKNKTKKLEAGAIFHAYNRGFEKRRIFKDHHDYATFLYLLKKYLEPGYKIDLGIKSFEPNHIIGEADLYAFCLMPNHFHLLLKQHTKYGMTKLMTRIASSYATYFNRKYRREGQLWQGTYKATRVYNDRDFAKIMNYIHENPIEIAEDIKEYKYSSMRFYEGEIRYAWLRDYRTGGVAPKQG